MSDRNMEWKVGVTVLGAIFVFIAGVIFLSESYIRDTELVLVVEFNHAGGIQEGDAVRVAGVKKGTVEKIELGDRNVRLTLKLQNDTILYEDAAFRIEAFGLMGEMMVSVSPGSGGKRIDPKRVQHGTYSSGLGGTMAEAGPLLEDLRRVIGRVEEVLDEERMIRPVEETIGNLKEISGDLEAILGGDDGDLQRSLAAGVSSAERVDRLLARNEANIDTSLAAAKEASGRLVELVDKLDRSSTLLEGILSGVERGEGTLGKLTKDDSLHTEIMETLDNMNRLIDDIRENPGRYLKIEIF